MLPSAAVVKRWTRSVTLRDSMAARLSETQFPDNYSFRSAAEVQSIETLSLQVQIRESKHCRNDARHCTMAGTKLGMILSRPRPQ